MKIRILTRNAYRTARHVYQSGLRSRAPPEHYPLSVPVRANLLTPLPAIRTPL